MALAKWSKYFGISFSMRRQAYMLLLLVLSSLILSGCLTGLWTGASLVYDRHDVYKKVSDFQLSANAGRALYKDNRLKCWNCVIDLAIFNGDILLAGHVPSEQLREEALSRIKSLKGYRRIFNQLSISNSRTDSIQDSWITTKIRSGILANSDIDPDQFKIVTTDKIVYLMGDVIPSQAKDVIYIARKCVGVRRVVKLFKYYNLSDKPAG